MAYGQNAPFGLRPIASVHGGSWTEKVNEYYIYASADGLTTYQNPIFTGDPVIWATSVGGTAANGKIGTIAVYNPNYADGTPATFGGVGTAPLLGVFMGCEYYSTAIGSNNLIKSPFWPGATQVQAGSIIKAWVLDDPSVIYDIQVSTNIAANANAFVGNPVFPNTNGNAGLALAGGAGRNFALSIGGGGNFETVQATIGAGNGQRTINLGYANNPATGSTLTGQSAFYLNVDTSTAPGYNNHDYAKTTTTLPLRALGYTQDVRNVSATIVPGNNVPASIQNTPFLNVRVTLNNTVHAVGSAATVYVA